MKYDRAGQAYELDHEFGDTLYVRPMIKFTTQTTSYHGDDFCEHEDYEPADFLVAKHHSDLFDAPPVELVDAEIRAKREGLAEFIAGERQKKNEAKRERKKAEAELLAAKSKLEKWFLEHRVMIELGKLLDGQVLYPLSVKENPYHHARDIPHIPEMRNAKYLAIHSGDFEKGQKWVCKQYGSDTYGSPFRFFDTEEERAAAIASEFEATCEKFRKNPAFGAPKYTTTTQLSYTTLEEWVETHPTLSIPKDIQDMKAEFDADQARKRRDELAAKLAEMDAKPA